MYIAIGLQNGEAIRCRHKKKKYSTISYKRAQAFIQFAEFMSLPLI